MFILYVVYHEDQCKSTGAKPGVNPTNFFSLQNRHFHRFAINNCFIVNALFFYLQKRKLNNKNHKNEEIKDR